MSKIQTKKDFKKFNIAEKLGYSFEAYWEALTILNKVEKARETTVDGMLVALAIDTWYIDLDIHGKKEKIMNYCEDIVNDCENMIYRFKNSNFFETLNDSLESEGLIELWPLGSNIQYGETVQHIVKHGKDTRLISVYRDNVNGRYERPVTYLTNR